MAILNTAPVRRQEWFRALFIVAALLLYCESSVSAQTTKEYEIKAAFLYNFAQFIEWPSNVFSDTKTPLVIAILGQDPFGSSLDDVVRDEKVNNRPLVIQRYQNIEDVKDCQILFISQSEAKRMDDILADLKNRAILTVGDADGFAKHGGMVGFITEKNKIRFRINVEATKTANLTISSKLLRLAEIVGSGKD